MTEERELYAAIDIGTNAGRLLIGYIIPQGDHLSVKKVQLVRVPFRLGEDVFSKGIITPEKYTRLHHALKGFRHVMKAYGVKEYRAVATSAMREAENGQQITMQLLQKSGLNLEIIDGEDEAEFIFQTFATQDLDHTKSYLFVDVGGGSTELTIIHKGERYKSKSFEVGTLRSIYGKVDDSVWAKIEKWIDKKTRGIDVYSAIGTGGNINSIAKRNKVKYLTPMSVDTIRITRDEYAKLSIEERIEKLRMKPDRADVIIPAADIYLRVMEIAGITEIVVPKMGLADGVIIDLYNRDKKLTKKKPS